MRARQHGKRILELREAQLNERDRIVSHWMIPYCKAPAEYRDRLQLMPVARNKTRPNATSLIERWPTYAPIAEGHYQIIGLQSRSRLDQLTGSEIAEHGFDNHMADNDSTSVPRRGAPVEASGARRALLQWQEALSMRRNTRALRAVPLRWDTQATRSPCTAATTAAASTTR